MIARDDHRSICPLFVTLSRFMARIESEKLVTKRSRINPTKMYSVEWNVFALSKTILKNLYKKLCECSIALENVVPI